MFILNILCIIVLFILFHQLLISRCQKVKRKVKKAFKTLIKSIKKKKKRESWQYDILKVPIGPKNPVLHQVSGEEDERDSIIQLSSY